MANLDVASLILFDLQSRYPDGMTSTYMQETYGPAAKSRIGDLRDAGWQIKTTMQDDQAIYALTSLRQRSASDRHVQLGVRVIQRPDGSWEITPYGTALDPDGSAQIADMIRYMLGVNKSPPADLLDPEDQKRDELLALIESWSI